MPQGKGSDAPDPLAFNWLTPAFRMTRRTAFHDRSLPWRSSLTRSGAEPCSVRRGKNRGDRVLGSLRFNVVGFSKTESGERKSYAGRA